MKIAIIALVAIVVLGAAGYFLFVKGSFDTFLREKETEQVETPTATSTETQTNNEQQEVKDETKTVIGTSADNHDITAYHFGTGEQELLFIGGIHGGYSWNTVLVAYELMDYLEKNKSEIPENVKVTVIPVMNPDGLEKVTGTTTRFALADVPSVLSERIPGRYNGNNVDLNRNFDCDWKEEGVWQNTKVSGGSEVFSEPESKAVRSYVEAHTPAGVVVWYSAAGGVFSSNCYNGVSEETAALTTAYAEASGYKAYKEFNFYDITGDMVNWFAKENIPAISVLLTNHEDVEWDKNLKGIKALFAQYAD